MAIDLGDPYPLTVLVTDDLGAPANAGAVVITITLPDSTTVTPAVVNGAVGTYSATYTPTLPGRYSWRSVATGVNACAFTDVFNVITASSLISLADARRGLRLFGVNTVTDEDLRELIADATPIMEDLVGSILSRPRSETYDGGRAQIVLLHSPLISVTSVVESYGSTYERTLTLQNRFDGSPVSAYGFDFDAETGLLTRLVSGVVAAFPQGRRNIQVTYISGRVAVSGNVLRATRLLIRSLWQLEQRAPMGPGVSAEPVTYIRGFAVPNAVIEMCAGDARTPGVA